MQPSFSNECPLHFEEINCFCLDCGLVMCALCSITHKCPMKKNHIEQLNEILTKNFKFQKYLGKGNLGSVFKVKSFLEDKIFALKVIEDVNKASFELLRKELAVLANIEHKNIIKYHSSNWIEEEEILWIVMDLCEGNLDKYLRNLDEKTALDYFLHNKNTDIWALGIILYKMVTQKNMHPFLQGLKTTKKNIITKIRKILNEQELKIDSSIQDPYMRKIIMGCLEKTPEKRITIQEILNTLIMKKQNDFGNSDKIDLQQKKIFLTCSALPSNQKSLESVWKLWKSLEGHKYYVSSVCFSPDGSKIISGSGDNTVKLWDFPSGNLLKTYEGHSNFVDSVCFSIDGSKIASGSVDKTIKIWEVS